MTSPNPQRQAMSLLEVSISVVILAMVSAMFLQGVIMTKHMESLGNAKDDVNLDAQKILRVLARDLSMSGWAYPSTGVASLTEAGDRADAYLPYVQLQNRGSATGGLGSQFTYTHRAESMVSLGTLSQVLPGSPSDATTLMAAGGRGPYLASFHARSQELLFVRQLQGPWAVAPESSLNPLGFVAGDWTDPSDTNRDALGVMAPSGWEAVVDGGGNVVGYTVREWDANGDGSVAAGEGDADSDGQPDEPYGVLLRSGQLLIDGSQLRLVPQWETVTAPDYDPSTEEPLRVFSYCVVPTQLGLGRLVRAYRALVADDPAPVAGVEVGQWITPISGVTEGMRVDEVLSDDVVRVVFDTFRTDDALDVNQVRARIYMARRQVTNPDVIVYRMVETVIAMRGRISRGDRENDLQFLIQSVSVPY